jgi:hypothetical protein
MPSTTPTVAGIASIGAADGGGAEAGPVTRGRGAEERLFKGALGSMNE